MDLGLNDKVVVATAAGSGIGLAITEAFLGEGAQMVVGDLDLSRLPADDRLLAVDLDLLTPEGPARLVTHALDRFGRVDVLVNVMGGLEPKLDGFAAVDDATWQATFDLNLFAAVRATRAAVPHMVAAGRGSIISIASDVARQPDPRFIDYCAAKAAVVSFSKALSIELGPKGVRCNVVSPGPIRTPAIVGFFERVAAEQGGSAEDLLGDFVVNQRRTPLGRMGHPSDVASVVLFLASDVARHVTGSDYRVDGGVVATA